MSPRRDPEESIEDLIGKKAWLDARIDALDARRQEIQKKNDDRLKWLLGSLVFDRLNDSAALRDFVRRELPDRMTARDQERGLWHLLFPEDAGDQP